jgi:hypothetical protein
MNLSKDLVSGTKAINVKTGEKISEILKGRWGGGGRTFSMEVVDTVDIRGIRKTK